MKINQIAAEQFAGVLDRSIRFADGMNVVLGANESGKSTMIAAMFHALTTPTKLDRRKHKDFLNRCFPTGGADTIDVSLTLTEQGRRYQLEKIWDKTGEETTAKLKTEDGLLRGPKAETELQALLGCGTAVYDHVVFGRQNHEEEILAWCYQFFAPDGDEDMEQVKKTVAAAYSAAEGISPERFLKLLDQQREQLSGHWDFVRQQPERGRDLDHPWVSGKGSVLEAYYTLRRAQQALQAGQELEQKTLQLKTKLTELAEEKRKLEDCQAQLRSSQGAAENLSKTRRLAEASRRELTGMEGAEQNWPSLTRQVQQAEALLGEQEEQKRRQRRAEVQATLDGLHRLKEQQTELESALAGGESLEADSREASRLLQQIQLDKASLTAGKLQADLALEAGYTACAEGAEGETRTLTGHSRMDVEGFLHVTIPGVAELRVAPGELDVEGLQQKLRENREALRTILTRDYAESTEELQQKASQWQQNQLKLRTLSERQKGILGGRSEEELTAELAELAVDESMVLRPNLDQEIREFLRSCGQKSLEAAQAGAKAALSSLEEAYAPRETLKERCAAKREELQSYEQTLKTLTEVEVPDALTLQQELAEAERRLDQISRDREKALEEKGLLSAQEQQDLSELEGEIQRCEEALEAEKRKYQALCQIREDFLSLQTETEDRLAGFLAAFSENLSRITDGRIQAANGSGLQLQSGRNALEDRELLSEGTRKTVLLAFRLAMLRSFFPEGGALVVLDDDLLDMDPERRRRAAELLCQFAENNQVIFTTCDPAMADLLGGTVIEV